MLTAVILADARIHFQSGSRQNGFWIAPLRRVQNDDVVVQETA
jgi:hypothetical protein